MFILFLVVGCRDPDKLLGDSNVYVDPIEIVFPDQADVGVAQPEGANINLQARVVDSAVVVDHFNLYAPCNHNFAVETEVEHAKDFEIEVNYGYDSHTLEDGCITNIYYELHLQDRNMEPGMYTIVAADDETQIDLYDYLTAE